MAGKETPKKAGANEGRMTKYKSGKADGRFCPRCGPGIFLAKMKGRMYCGKCHYTEFTKE